jgi:abortive infection bacteriophage resistance protein
MPSYTKPYLSLPDQIQLLKHRGLQVADDVATMECLHRNGYYRLSAYWYPFREIVAGKRTDTFLPGSRFENAVDLYRFDKKFKLVLLDAIERVEIAARVEVAMVLGRRDPFAYLDSRRFRPEFRGHQKWLEKFQDKQRGSTDEFVFHYQRQYGIASPMPIWIAIELWDFGMLSHAFTGMQELDQTQVAARFSVPDWRILASWLWTLNYIRNVIAHHGRLWNRNLSVNPRLPRRGQIPDFDDSLPLNAARIHSVCCILCYLTSVINPQSSWIGEMKNMVNNFPSMPYASIQDMGFPAGW